MVHERCFWNKTLVACGSQFYIPKSFKLVVILYKVPIGASKASAQDASYNYSF